MKSIKIEGANLRESFTEFKETREFHRINRKFSHQAYEKENKQIKGFATWLGYGCSVGSFCLAYSFATSELSTILNSTVLGVLIGSILLGCQEIAQHIFLNKIFTNHYLI